MVQGRRAVVDRKVEVRVVGLWVRSEVKGNGLGCEEGSAMLLTHQLQCGAGVQEPSVVSDAIRSWAVFVHWQRAPSFSEPKRGDGPR